MQQINFPEANITAGPPQGFSEAQCQPIRAFRGCAEGGSCDGLPLYITAWFPTVEETEMIMQGHPIYLTIMGTGLPPHMLTTSFDEASKPA